MGGEDGFLPRRRRYRSTDHPPLDPASPAAGTRQGNAPLAGATGPGKDRPGSGAGERGSDFTALLRRQSDGTFTALARRHPGSSTFSALACRQSGDSAFTARSHRQSGAG